MNEKEQRVYNETRLRNLKRKLAKLTQHPTLIEETLEIKAQINELEKTLR